MKVPSGDLDYKPAPTQPARLDVKNRMPKFVLPATVADTKLYSFRATGQPVRLALSQLATAYKLNIVVDQDVEGLVTVDLNELPLEKVLEAVLEPVGLAWQWQDGLLRVSRLETRTFSIDYMRLVRSGNGNSSTSTSLASGGGGGGGGGGSTGNSSSTIAQNDTIDFWNELEEQLDAILERSDDDYTDRERPMETTVQTDRETNITTTLTQPVRESAGRLIIDRLSGTIQVTTSRARMKNVVEFLKRVEKGITRQVYIEAKVVEVSLNDDQSLGIDWTLVDNSWSLQSTTLPIGPADGISGAAGTLAGSYVKTLSGIDVSVALEALKEQGQVQVVSQPRIRTLNNQSAIVRVGTDQPFFIRTTTIVSGDNPIENVTDTLNNVTEGLVLTVTPQISEDGVVTMDVTPVLTRISGSVSSEGGLSTAPVLDIKQTSTLVRVYDGDTIVVGGLIQETLSNNKRAVPLLGELPMVGTLFSSTYDREEQKEMVVFLTPHIIQ
jgi:MSHA type pilus biogenesis protein MshL